MEVTLSFNYFAKAYHHETFVNLFGQSKVLIFKFTYPGIH